MKQYRWIMAISLWLICAGTVNASPGDVSIEVESVKKELIEIENSVDELESKLTGPNTMKMGVFLKMNSNTEFEPLLLELKIPGFDIVRKEFSSSEVYALKNSGIAIIGEFLIEPGKYPIDLVVRGESNRHYGSSSNIETLEYKRSIEKGLDYLTLLFNIQGSESKLSLKVW